MEGGTDQWREELINGGSGDVVRVLVVRVWSLVLQRMQVEFHKWMAWYGKSYGEYEIIKGDFLLEAFDSIISQATLV